MNPIEFEVKKKIKNSAKKICDKVLDVTTWNSFDGHGLLPGIEKAEYEKRTDEIIGSRIRVKNSDGTQHLEEILEWEAGKKLIMKIHEFPSSLSYIATHFIEEWNFRKIGKNETLVTRNFKLYPTSFLTRLLLGQIAALFEKAVEKHLDDMANEMRKN
jgi:hypothetical protein